MERIKLVLLGAIAVALWIGVVREWMPVANAQASAAPRCNAWVVQLAPMNEEKGHRTATEHAAEVAAWMAQNPGEPVYHASFQGSVSGGSNSTVELLCVR